VTKLKALKSCLECLTSYCETHLQHHQIAPALKRHKLINPVENLEDRMCKKHKRPLELFCRTDQMCVCQFCTVTDHKGHHTVSLRKEFGEKKAELGRTKNQVQQMIHKCLQKVKEIKHSAELSNRDAEREIEKSEQVFTTLVRSMQRSQAEVAKMIGEKQKATQRQAEGLIKELEQEITELQRRRSELEQLSHSKDHLHLLQSSSSLCTPTSTKDWSDVSITWDQSKWNVQKDISQLDKKVDYEAFTDPHTSLSLKSKPEKLGVFVDYEEGQVSFYDVDTRSHIFSFTGCTFTEKLYPYLNPFDDYDGSNSAPMIITPVNQTP
ncbi:hypothetical protein J4Q44_G00364960, partial [Coregonus suidteri]